ncbi:hypothetical protein EON63_02995 [archaeon]|nr:MAG: hypothetical protein EON63_02995 [archaeon]
MVTVMYRNSFLFLDSRKLTFLLMWEVKVGWNYSFGRYFLHLSGQVQQLVNPINFIKSTWRSCGICYALSL